jgi:hypothetical protein
MFTPQFWADPDKEQLRMEGRVYEVKVHEVKSTVRKLYGSVYLFANDEEYKVEGEKAFGIESEFIVDLKKAGTKDTLLGYRIKGGVREKLFSNKLKWKTAKEANWPEALRRPENAIPDEKRIKLTTLAKRGDFQGTMLDIDGKTGTVTLGRRGSGTNWRFRAMGDSYRIENLGDSDFHGWYLDFDETGKLMLSESSRGSGTKWRIEKQGDGFAITSDASARSKFRNYYLDIDGRKGTAILSEKQGSGALWKAE